MDLIAKPECNPNHTSAVELACYAQTLMGEQIVVPACARHDAPSRTVIEQEEWERLQQEREQKLTERLLVQMKRKARQRKRCAHLFLGAGSAAFGLGGLLMLDGIVTDTTISLFVVVSFVALLSALCGVWLHAQMTNLVALLPASDVRAVGPLLDALHYADMQGIPQRALQELLPQVTPADSVLFSDAHRQSLCRALSDPNTDLVVMALHTLEKIGDGRAISPVAHLAAGGGRARIDGRVQAAAQRCLPVLQARAVYDAANQTLLRPSAASAPVGAQLLRACEATDDIKPRELLRAGPCHGDI